MWTAINGAVGQARARKQDPELNWDRLQADTVVDLITGARARDPRCPEVSVLIDIETLRDGLHDATVCETSDGIPLPPDAVRRMACDADMVPVVLGSDGEALDVGRGNRLATRAQRRALNSKDSTCGFPGCTVSFDACGIHHVIPWEQGGPTDLDNLLPLCEREHHHLVHEGQWKLTLRADRTITLNRPDGTRYFEGNTTNRKPRHQAGVKWSAARNRTTRTLKTKETQHAPPTERDSPARSAFRPATRSAEVKRAAPGCVSNP